MEIKILCGCGTKYKFDVEPVNGRMPVAAICPGCGTNGTFEANRQIAERLGAASQTPPPPAPAVSQPPAVAGLRLTGAGRALATLMEGETPAGSVSGETAQSLLQRTTFFIKERVAVLKLTDTYDILDPVSGQPIGTAKEEPPTWAKWLRLVVKKHMLPTAINVYEAEGQPPVLSVKRGFTFIRSKLNVVSGGRPLGYFKSKLISIGGGFHVYDHANQPVAEVKGNWKGWDFRFVNRNGREIGTVTKKWAGLGQELFTSADNYIISLTDLSGASPETSALLLAAGLAIDVVYKEDE
jgi:uncharacterized protein YxjI